jgi:hypothetical protein
MRNLDWLRSYRDKRFPLFADIAGGTHVANGTAMKKAVRRAFNPRKKADLKCFARVSTAIRLTFVRAAD